MIAYTFYESDTRVMQYATSLRKRGDIVDIIALRRDGNQPSFEVLDGVNIHRIQARTINETGIWSYIRRIFLFLVRSMCLLWAKHRQAPYHLVHVHNVPDFLVFSALPIRLKGIPIILDIHDLLPEFYASKFEVSNRSLLFSMLKAVEYVSASVATHVIIANHIWRDRFIQRSAKAEKCSVIRNYPDLDLFGQHTSAKDSTTDQFLIIYPGSLNVHQGLDVAIRAFARIADKIPGAMFHIYGEGSAKTSLIQLADKLGMRERVDFHGALPSAEIARIMAKADLAIEPKCSKSTFGNEALSTKILEFMTLGVPLIASKTKIHSYYYDESLIHYYENDDDAALSECILRMWRDPELRSGYARRATIYAKEHNWQVKQSEYLQLVDLLVYGPMQDAVEKEISTPPRQVTSIG